MKNLVAYLLVILTIYACQEDEFKEQTINELANTIESLPTATCTTIAAALSEHAMWMGKYKDGKSAHFFFYDESGKIEFFEDSSAHITGTVYLPDNSGDKWNIDVWITNPMNWEEWSSLGRTYKGDEARVGELYKDWLYYTFDNSKPNRLTGFGINAGDTLELRQYPYNLEYGLQIGFGSNDKNNNFGLSVWFTYYLNGNLYEGDFNFDLDCPGIPSTNVQVTTIAGGSFNFDQPDGIGEKATLDNPEDLCVDTEGNIYTVTTGQGRIFKVTPSGDVTTFIGSDTDKEGMVGGTSIAIDRRGNLYTDDGRNILKITPDKVVTTFVENFVGTESQTFIPGLVVDENDNLLIADDANHKIRKVTPDGLVTTIAGSVMGFADGPVQNALFSYPTSIVLDLEGNILVADHNNHRIRKISTDGIVTTFAGSTIGYEEGFRLDAKFRYPTGLAIDHEQNLYVVDQGNYRIRKILPNGQVETLAGSERGFYEEPDERSGLTIPGTYLDGPGTIAKFVIPREVTIDDNGTLYVADLIWIRRITQ
jgi:sugar lactone lactonase YvrE